jgi:hypothetical protein
MIVNQRGPGPSSGCHERVGAQAKLLIGRSMETRTAGFSALGLFLSAL